MPYVIEKRGEEFCVLTQGADGDGEGSPHGCHPTREQAVTQMRALYANVPDAGKAYIPQAERDALPAEDFGDPERRLYPIRNQDDVDSAAHLIGKADAPEAVKKRIIAICRRKGLTPPDAWTAEKKSADDGLLAFLGGSVKAEGAGVAAGYLITFGGPKDGDTSRWRDYFTPATDFEIKSWPASSPVRYHHGLTDEIGKRRIDDDSEMKADEIGVFIRAQLKMRDEWIRRVYHEIIEPGKASWSSGTAVHLVEREPVLSDGSVVAHEVKRWPLRLDATITPTPADWRNDCYAIKAMPMPPSLTALPSSSLRERVERWREDLTRLSADGVGYAEALRELWEAEVKVGSKMSRSRYGEMKQAHEMLGKAHSIIGGILTECAAPLVEGDFPGTTASGMDGGSSDTITALGREMLRLKAKSYRHRGGLS